MFGSHVSHKIRSKLKESFKNHLLSLEDLRNDPRDYRLTSLSDKGTGKVHDIVDPSLNCFEDSWIATEFIIKRQ